MPMPSLTTGARLKLEYTRLVLAGVFQQCLQTSMCCHVCLDLRSVGRHHLKTLRQRLDVVKTSRTLGVPAQCFPDGFIELGRQGRFQHDHGHARSEMLARDLDTVSGVSVNGDAVGLLGETYRRQPIGVSGFAGGETVTNDIGKFSTIAVGVAAQVETTCALNLVKQRLDARTVAAQQIK